MGPERLDRVIVKTSQVDVVLPWASRDALLHEIHHLDSLRPVTEAFEAVGATSPVRIPQEMKGPLANVIDFWSSQRTVDGLPAGVWELRNELLNDVHDHERREPES